MNDGVPVTGATARCFRAAARARDVLLASGVHAANWRRINAEWLIEADLHLALPEASARRA